MSGFLSRRYKQQNRPVCRPCLTSTKHRVAARLCKLTAPDGTPVEAAIPMCSKCRVAYRRKLGCRVVVID